MTTRKNIVFFHPDLGIGGAERLVIDAAVGLQNRGHKVTVFTSHCDAAHCFDEARDGTLDVRVRGHTFFPPALFARFHILMAILRHYHLLVSVALTGEMARLRPEVFFVDQVAAGVPVLRVVYPCVDTGGGGEGGGGDEDKEEEGRGGVLWRGKKVVLSINRFERKKDVGLAVRAFAGLGGEGREGVRLVIAGGYDNRVQENVSYHNELVSLAESLSLKTATAKNVVTALSIPSDIDVLFLLSVPAKLKSMLLNAARLLVYTPSNEHFGIVPLEAMLAGVPVLAANSGGPLETIVDGETGWLRPADDVEQWTELMRRVLFHFTEEHLRHMGEVGRKRVKEEFSETKMARGLDEEIEALVKAPRVQVTELPDVLLGLGILGMVAVAVTGVLYKQFIQ
ncbi:MAG: glycosyltransferase family 4 [Lasallia pustulata]|uniref:Alpha-1,3/1,6-mannosyltransferase ALG2 n=1 Tax=Lasallia pustulata TaxID=136370 RepID=A0A5M8PER1_9LECA|nr:MAG: glycosyltransferase family 4 [Lasallia pustulata]